MKNPYALLVLILFFGGCKVYPSGRPDYRKMIKNHREEYKMEFLKDNRSPLDRKGIANLDFYEPDIKYKLVCDVEMTPDEAPFDMATYSGKVFPYRTVAIANCTLEDRQFDLHIYENINLKKVPLYEDYLFLPFKDLTNGGDTYGGGRYLDFRTSDINDGKIVIDFNKAYNPWCAYSEGYSCPVPPKENHLDMRIEAGEKVYRKK